MSSLFGQICLLKIAIPLETQGYSLKLFKNVTLKRQTTNGDRGMRWILEHQELREVHINSWFFLQS